MNRPRAAGRDALPPAVRTGCPCFPTTPLGAQAALHDPRDPRRRRAVGVRPAGHQGRAVESRADRPRPHEESLETRELKCEEHGAMCARMLQHHPAYVQISNMSHKRDLPIRWRAGVAAHPTYYTGVVRWHVWRAGRGAKQRKEWRTRMCHATSHSDLAHPARAVPSRRPLAARPQRLSG